jgi:hypothetical protein
MMLSADYIENNLLTPKMMFDLVRLNTYRKVTHQSEELELINFHSALTFDDTDLFWLTPASDKSVGAAHPVVIDAHQPNKKKLPNYRAP